MNLLNPLRLVTSLSMLFLLGCQSITVPAMGDLLSRIQKDNTAIEASDDIAQPLLRANYTALAITSGEVTSYATHGMPKEASSSEDLIVRIQNGLAFEATINPLVNEHILWFQRNPNYLNLVLDRSVPYLYHIVNGLDERGMPLELALLPIIESAYDPYAYSVSDASGLWQIIPDTADYLGLKRNGWVDERRDIIKSTDAALNYLEELYNRLNQDWLLAVAGYNAGGTTIQNAMNKSDLQNDFWSIRPIIPRETQNYVPRLMALSIIFRYPDLFGIDLPAISSLPYFYELQTKKQVDLTLLASVLEMDMKSMTMLNPSLNHWATEPDTDQILLVPINKREQSEQWLSELIETQVIFQNYEIKSGDNLSIIAYRFNTTVEAIQLANPEVGSIIYAGRELVIPTGSQDFNSYVLATNTNGLATRNAPLTPRNLVHHVVNGDTLYSISQFYSVSINEIASLNRLNLNDSLSLGQELMITRKDALPSNLARRIRYTVRNGDSLSAIANRYNVDVNDITNLNQIGITDYIRPGQDLLIDISN
jgi:membrane-bound lytic murein transglycosylase D